MQFLQILINIYPNEVSQYIGSGKTTIFNKCRNKNQKIEVGGKSVTRQTFMTDSAIGWFQILGTPWELYKQNWPCCWNINDLVGGPIISNFIQFITHSKKLIYWYVSKFYDLKLIQMIVVQHIGMKLKSVERIKSKNEVKKLKAFIKISIKAGQLMISNLTNASQCKNAKVELTETKFTIVLNLLRLKNILRMNHKKKKELEPSYKNSINKLLPIFLKIIQNELNKYTNQEDIIKYTFF